MGDAAARAEERARIAAQRAAAQQVRRERETAAARQRRLDALAARQEQAWQEVGALVETRKPREYDRAVALLADLKALADRSGTLGRFAERYRRLREQHLRKPSLIERFDEAGLST